MGSEHAAAPSFVHEWPPALRAQARDAAVRAEHYLRSRQSASGGFCFYRWQGVDEPSLHDTWHAVAAFTLLGIAVPRRDDVVAFIDDFDVGGLDHLYHSALTRDLLGREPAPARDVRERVRGLDAVAALANEQVHVAGRLQHALRIVTLQHRLAAIDSPQAIVDGVNALRCDGGWGDKPNLADTWLALAILGRCDVHALASETRTFVDALQLASFGFTATRDSTYANLDTVHAGVRACAALGLPMRHAADAVAFLLGCQTEAGGFAPASDALPNIGLTHRGLLALAAVGTLQVKSAARLDDDTGW